MLDQHDGRFERDRFRPNRGSVTLEHRLGATGGAALPGGESTLGHVAWIAPIVSICSDVGQGAVAIFERRELEINAMTAIRVQLPEMQYDN